MADDPRLDKIILSIAAINAKLDALLLADEGKPKNGKAEKQETGRIAKPEELDGEWGDPKIWMDKIKEWDGDSMKDRRMSECPADFLDIYAEALDRVGVSKKKAGDEKHWRFFSDAGRARGWSKRSRKEEAPF
jgi:hypothetical protein